MPDTSNSPNAHQTGPLRGSLGITLFLWLFGVVLAAFTAYAYWSARNTAGEWRETIEAGALRSSELIKKSTHYGMLLNRKEDVHQIIRTTAEAPGVLGVRIYDKEGRIIYSADDSEIGHRVDLEAEACIVCHERERPLESLGQAERVRVYRGPAGGRVLGLINPIENTPACSNADCHAHAPDQTVLGVLDVKVSMAEADSRLEAMEQRGFAAALVMALLTGLSSVLFIDRFVRRPVKRLIDGTARVSQGNLETGFATDGRGEIGQLAASFNRMTADLRRAREENEAWARELERKVLEKTEELSRTQRQVVHMEKMASLGKLAATVAHELNNPLAGILNYAKLVERSLHEGQVAGRELEEDERAELERFLVLIQKESGRCGEIVRNLLLFARRSGTEFSLQPLSEIVERARMIVRHRLELGGVEWRLVASVDDDHLICDPGQLEQALVALFVNAVEAMEGGGTLTARLREVGEELEITLADTGVGIPTEDLSHIFEPFYTTKEHSDGAGLGLAVVYGIVERHGGRIEVDSNLGRGTEFRLLLPRRPKVEGKR